MDVPFTMTADTRDSQKLGARTLIALVRKRAWLIGLCAVFGGIAALAFSTTLPKLYTASGAITVAGQNFAIPELQGALRGSSDTDSMIQVRTELQALESRQLVEQVSRDLQLARLKEFNPTLVAPGFVATKLAALSRDIFGNAPSSHTGSVEDAVVAAASRNLIVFNDNRSLVITIGFTSADPQLSADFINTLIRLYRAGQAAQRGAADEAANSILLRQIDQLNGEIAGLEQQVRDTRDKGQLVGLRAGSIGQQQLEELATGATRASLDRSQIQANWERANALARRGASDDFSGVLSSETIGRLREQEGAAARRYAELSTRFGSSYPAVRDAQATLTAAHDMLAQEIRRIIDSLGAQLQVARQHEADAQAQLTQARGEALKSATVQGRLDDLRQEIASRRALADTLQQRAQQTVSRPSTTETPDVRVLNAAVPPGAPSSPKTRLAGAIGAMAGAMLGLLIAIARSGRGEPIGDVVALANGVPVMALLPATSARTRQALLTRVATETTGEEAEALRMLRTRIRLSSSKAVPRVIAMIPAQRGEDGARIASAFARVAAGDGERVLLVEGNLQSPELSALLSVRGGKLPIALAGRMEWRDAVRRDRTTSLDMLLADQPTTEAHAVLSSLRFQNMLVEASDDYNLIVLSAPPPAVQAASALVLGHRADASILIVDGSTAERSAISSFAEDLMRSSSGPVTAMLIRPR